MNVNKSSNTEYVYHRSQHLTLGGWAGGVHPSHSLCIRHKNTTHETRRMSNDLCQFIEFMYFFTCLWRHMQKKRSQLFNRLQKILTLQAQRKWWLRFSVISLILKYIFTVNRKLQSSKQHSSNIFGQHETASVNMSNIFSTSEVCKYSC